MKVLKINPDCLGRHIFVSFVAGALLPVTALAVDGEMLPLSPGPLSAQTTGEGIYRTVCQGCHMASGTGAIGAGSYPSLASNKNLRNPGYPVMVLQNGKGGMPPMKPYLSEQQIRAVADYIRTHFGNNFGPMPPPVAVQSDEE